MDQVAVSHFDGLRSASFSAAMASSTLFSSAVFAALAAIVRQASITSGCGSISSGV